MQAGFLTYRSSRIAYTCYGKGSRLLICLHGYGESGTSFALLEETLGEEFTLLAVDLPFHGGTEWCEGLLFDPPELLAILEGIAASLPGVDGEQWWLLGYSMGGRVALNLLEQVPVRIIRMVLLAPDGLVINPWYRLATQTGAGNRFFRWTMAHPAWLAGLLRLGHTLGLVNRSVYKFTRTYVGDATVRSALYTRWTVMRAFRPDLRTIRSLIRKHQIPVRLLYGRWDRIIRWQRGEAFRRGGIEAYCQVIVLSAGHQLLQPRNIDVIVSALKDN